MKGGLGAKSPLVPQTLTLPTAPSFFSPISILPSFCSSLPISTPCQCQKQSCLTSLNCTDLAINYSEGYK